MKRTRFTEEQVAFALRISPIWLGTAGNTLIYAAFTWRPRWRHLGPTLVESVQRDASFSM